MKKEELLARFRDEFLRGKSEEKRNEFLAKSEEKQIQSLRAWRTRLNKLKSEAPSAGIVAKTIKEAREMILKLSDMTNAERNSLKSLLADTDRAIDEFDNRKLQEEIARLEKEIDNQRNGIRAKEQELNELRNRIGNI